MSELRWRKPDPPIVTQWRGPAGTNAVSALTPLDGPLAALIGPPGLTGPSPLSGTLIITLPPGEGAYEHSQWVSASGVIPSHRLFLTLAAGGDDDENIAEMLDLASLSGVAWVDQINITACFSVPVSGPVTLDWSAF